MRHLAVCAALALLVSSCSPSRQSPQGELHVAAAANLTKALAAIAEAFEKQTRIKVVPSYGATALLAQQIENGAPFDVFLSADVSHVDQLIQRGAAEPASRAIYARGQLVVWAPRRPDLRTVQELADPKVRGIIVAKPELAPYGEAAIESMKNLGLWDQLQKEIVYAPSILAAKQFVESGNGDAAFTALSLILDQPGNYFFIDEKYHKPIYQALCIVRNAKNPAAAAEFAGFLQSPAGRDILKRFGYGQP